MARAGADGWRSSSVFLRFSTLLGAWWLALAPGCTSSAPDELPEGAEAQESHSPTAFWTIDSAGVEIAVSADSAWTSENAWTVDPVPFLVIGTRAGEIPGTDLASTSGALRLSDDRIVVADPPSSQLRVFDEEGNLDATIGRSGEGPGEFQFLGQFSVLRGDSIVTWDAANRRITVFQPDGSTARTLPGPPSNWNGLSPTSIEGWLDDGSFFLTHQPQVGQLPMGLAVAQQEWHYFDRDGGHVRQVATLPAFHAHDRGSVAFAPRSEVQVHGTGFWYGFPDRYELHHYSTNGLERIVRRAWEPEPVPSSAVEGYRRDYARSLGLDDPDLPPELRGSRQARLEQLAFADVLPAFSGFRVSTDGHLWVRHQTSAEELSEPDATAAPDRAFRDWTVFDPAGRWLGTVALPRAVTVREIGPDYVMGWRTDAFDVPQLVLHRVLRPVAP